MVLRRGDEARVSRVRASVPAALVEDLELTLGDIVLDVNLERRGGDLESVGLRVGIDGLEGGDGFEGVGTSAEGLEVVQRSNYTQHNSCKSLIKLSEAK